MIKKSISILFIIVLLTLTGCNNGEDTIQYSQAELLAPYHKRNVGKISKDEPFEYKIFLLNNHKDNNITLLQAKTSNISLVATIKDKTIRHIAKDLGITMIPNERRFLTFKYNPKLDPDRDTGKFSQTVILQTDYKDNEFVEVSIEGEFR